MRLVPKKALAVSHVAFENLGTLRHVLSGRGFEIDEIDAATADWDVFDATQFDLVVILGGPLGVADEPSYPFLTREIAFIKQCVDASVPLIGACLGAQLIASVLGANVTPMGVKEIGFAAVELTEAGLESALHGLGSTPVLHWHGDEFEIPEGALHLARTSIGRNQAFALGKHILGLQFHLEVECANIERWLVGNSGELVQAKIAPAVLRAQALRYGNELASVSAVVFTRWLRDLGL
ncbi:MAG: glutamine amidotransferase [Burkholderiales bacterium]|nr:glutamine amidotransferase [Burkholderiales bacterium]